MSIFCLLWTPFFYLFWRSVSGSRHLAGGVWAVLGGCIAALLRMFLGSIVDPGEFGVSRWLNACVDIVVLPALAPFLVYLVIIFSKFISGPYDFANFAQLWLIPCAAIRALSWSSQNDPIQLILVPVLWTAISVGVSFLIDLLLKSRKLVIIPAALGMLIIAFASASSYWAFFSQRSNLGFLLLFAAAAPMLVYMILAFNKT